MRITILGCGSSTGVPMLGNNWGKCDPAEPRNRRTRPAILIERQGKIVLVDAGADIRAQLLAADVKKLDAVIFTHDHADHTHGIDDLRGYGMKTPLDAYAYGETIESIRHRFHYMFGGAAAGYHPRPFLALHAVEMGEPIPALDIVTFPQSHTVCTTLGLRCGAFAYSADLKLLGDDGFQKLAGVDTWVVSALRREPHVAHACLSEVLQWIELVKPRRAILTHMNPSMDYVTLRNELLPHVEPAYDGMVIELDD